MLLCARNYSFGHELKCVRARCAFAIIPAAAKKQGPCIIFMDEIDAVGGKRSGKDQQYSKMTLNQLLVELDGFHKDDQVIVIAATNFAESLDPVRACAYDTAVAAVPLVLRF